ncbi:MAG: hypothetical protein R3E66_12815 [bacterium]
MKYIAPILVALIMVGCDKPAEQPQEPAATATQAEAVVAAPSEAAPEKAAESGASMVTVTAEGTTFDPPVKPEQIPAGAWYCDMGTVEYASLEKGDGKCPKCGMMLKQKPGADGDKPAEGDNHDGHEGHDHDGHAH